eukprot:scaffold45453_cov32-Tisochrysis_lutea.AAC.7
MASLDGTDIRKEAVQAQKLVRGQRTIIDGQLLSCEDLARGQKLKGVVLAVQYYLGIRGRPCVIQKVEPRDQRKRFALASMRTGEKHGLCNPEGSVEVSTAESAVFTGRTCGKITQRIA